MYAFYTNTMRKSITPELMEKYFQSGRLGNLSIEIPHCGTVSVDLVQLYRSATGLEFFEYQVRPEDIDTMVVYGSVLYRHFPPKEITRTRKKWYLFGPEVEGETIETRDIPEDFDLMVITEEGPSEDKRIFPERVPWGYGSKVVFAAVKTERTTYGPTGVSVMRDGIPLHIAYRSVDQFLDGLEKGDTVSESIIRYGLPIVEKEKFEEVVRDIRYPERETLHEVEWREDTERVLQGEIL